MEDYLRSLLSYDPESGVVSWKVARNGVAAGTPVSMDKRNGYSRMTISKDGKRYHFVAHRVAWLLYYNHMPAGDIDHINRVRDDNRISNLRIATRRENARNTAAFCSGVQKHGERFRARIVAPDGVRVSLGCYPTREMAESVFVAVDKALFP